MTTADAVFLQGQLTWIARQFVGTKERPISGDDLVQAGMLRVLEREPTWDRGRLPWRPWAIAIGRFGMIDYLRERLGRSGRSDMSVRIGGERLDLADVLSYWQGADDAHNIALAHEIDRALDRVCDARGAAIIRLTYLHGWTLAEAGAVFGFCESRAGQVRLRAVAAVRRTLGADTPDAAPRKRWAEVPSDAR